MHLAEAAAGASSAQRAAAHARAAEILERRLRRPADAAFHHAQALALVPGFPASFKALVRLYGQSGQHRELVELYERAIDETTTVEWKVTYLFNVGALWEEALGDGTQAAHAYRRILELQSDNLGALHALQRVLEKTEQYDKLVSCLEREAELTQEMDLVLGLLHRAGTILDEQIGDQTAAKQRFLKALDIDPSFVPALASLGRIHYRAGQWDDLLQMYRRELDATDGRRARAWPCSSRWASCASDRWANRRKRSPTIGRRSIWRPRIALPSPPSCACCGKRANTASWRCCSRSTWPVWRRPPGAPLPRIALVSSTRSTSTATSRRSSSIERPSPRCRGTVLRRSPSPGSSSAPVSGRRSWTTSRAKRRRRRTSGGGPTS